jgi:hypothetical protein
MNEFDAREGDKAFIRVACVHVMSEFELHACPEPDMRLNRWSILAGRLSSGGKRIKHEANALCHNLQLGKHESTQQCSDAHVHTPASLLHSESASKHILS